MAKNLDEWILRIKTEFPEIVTVALRLCEDNIALRLNEYHVNKVDTVSFIATFIFPNDSVTTIFFGLMDYQTDSDVVITNMATLPKANQSNGFGSQAVQKLLTWAKQNNLHEVRATQVGDPNSQRFWEKNGFVRCPDPNPCSDYIYRY